MNILVVGKFYAEGFALHIAETLSTGGHSVRRFEPGYRHATFQEGLGHHFHKVGRVLHLAIDSVPAAHKYQMKALWQRADEGPLDVIIVCHDFLRSEEVAELKRRTGAEVALWFPDHLANFGKAFFMNCPYDALFFKDPYIVKTLNGVLRSPVYYLPEAFNPDRHCLPAGAVLDKDYNCDIATAGNSHSWRVALYNHLTDWDVKIWGAPPPLWMSMGAVGRMYQGRSVHNAQKAQAFLGAKIVLNNLHYAEIVGVNVRTFEAAGIGAFQMLDWRPGLRQLFEDGHELISFKGIDDLKTKIRYWLDRPDERKIIADAGKRRAYSDHTYALRLSLLLKSLAQRASGYPIEASFANSFVSAGGS